jgi:hypothetical protein
VNANLLRTEVTAIHKSLILQFPITREVVTPKVSILNRVGSILVPRGIFRLIIACTFIVNIGTICF